MIRYILTGLAVSALALAAPVFEREDIIPLDVKHTHASSIVELPNGDLLACWYRGSGERTADDVVVLGDGELLRAPHLLQPVRDVGGVQRRGLLGHARGEVGVAD
ncbi:MAG: hypothetical protein JNL62_02440, partial [Bryobacterales bacterium]|nr:hypothetical protein [Bryobacterales bacterium]